MNLVTPSAAKIAVATLNANEIQIANDTDVVDSSYVDFSNSYKADSYKLLGFRAGINRTGWQAFVEFSNLTDEKYVSTFSVVNQYASDASIFNTGGSRAFYAGVQLSL